MYFKLMIGIQVLTFKIFFKINIKNVFNDLNIFILKFQIPALNYFLKIQKRIF